jgi:hypothetical protein
VKPLVQTPLLAKEKKKKSWGKCENMNTGTYRSRLLKQNNTPRRVISRNAKQTGTTMASISP